MRRRFTERELELLTQHKVTALNPDTKQAPVAGHEPMAYDLFIGVPIHRPPQVVRDSALGQGGWIRVNRSNLATGFENVCAVGDVITIPVGQLSVPRACAFAEDAAKVVVSDVIYQINGKGQPSKFELTGTCFLEFGDGNVAQISANYLGQEEPQVALEEPSAALREGKQRF